MSNKKIAFVINHAAFFESHILPVANEAKKKYNVKLFCGMPASLEMDKFALKELKKNKISFTKYNFSSSSINIFKEFVALIRLKNSLRSFQPDLIHCATPKGILFGGLLSKILKVESLVVFNTGMGFLYTNKLNLIHQIAKYFYVFVLKNIIMKHPNKKIIVENKIDYKFLKKNYFLKKNEIILLNGSGVNLSKFKKQKLNDKKIVLLPSRVIKEKGIKEFVIAANKLKDKFPSWNFYVAGTLNYKKKSGFTENEIKSINKNNNVKFLGYVRDMIKLYKKISIVCLPSHREGFSKTLQEAAALGIPTVTTDAIGCKNAIIPGKTGELCKTKNPNSLEKSLEKLINNKRKRIIYGNNGRKLAKKNFDLKKILKKNLKIYKTLFSNEKTYFYSVK